MDTNTMRYYLGWAVIAVTAIVIALLTQETGDLEFVDLASPPGFRSLVLNGGTGRSGVVPGELQHLPAATDGPAVDLCSALLRDGGSPVLGPEDSEISIVEFFDYRCPYCKTLRQILSQLHGERSIRIVYKEWPILGESSRLAARAALAAARQGKYHPFHARLMAARFVPTQPYIEDLAAEQGVDTSRLRRDMAAPAVTSALRRNAAVAAQLGLVGTPALVVGRTIVQGAISREQLERLIDYELSSQSPSVC